VIVGACTPKLSLPTITKVSRKQGKFESSWILLSNGRDKFSSRVNRGLARAGHEDLFVIAT
jgi:hypothetical protein